MLPLWSAAERRKQKSETWHDCLAEEGSRVGGKGANGLYAGVLKFMWVRIKYTVEGLVSAVASERRPDCGG